MENAEFLRLVADARFGESKQSPRLGVVRAIREHGGGMTLEELLDEFPDAERSDLAAAIATAIERGSLLYAEDGNVLTFVLERKRSD